MSDSPLAERPFDVVGLGTNALDLIAIIDGYPKPDTKAQFQTFDVQGGGVVATARAAATDWSKPLRRSITARHSARRR